MLFNYGIYNSQGTLSKKHAATILDCDHNKEQTKKFSFEVTNHLAGVKNASLIV